MSMTKQEMFDKALNGIRAQGGASMSKHDACCRYILGERMCAIGLLVGPGDLVCEIDQRAAGSVKYVAGYDKKQLNDRFAASIGLNLADLDQLEFLGQLQSAHDHAAMDAGDYNDSDNGCFVVDDVLFMKYFEANAERLAKRHRLVYTPPAQ